MCSGKSARNLGFRGIGGGLLAGHDHESPAIPKRGCGAVPCGETPCGAAPCGHTPPYFR